MYLYEASPIDYWGAAIPLEEAISRCTEGDLRTLMTMVMCAARAAESWEGDITELGLFFLPADVTPMPCLAWKQQNNGTTFVYTPVELPWLGKDFVVDRMSPFYVTLDK